MTDLHLRLTEASHADQEFYALGPIPLEVPARAVFDRLPTDPPHVCDDNDTCWMVDLWEGDYDTGGGHIDDREVSRKVAVQLFGGSEEAFEDARTAAREELAGVYAWLRTRS